MKLTILGSGVLIPVAKRGNSGYFLQASSQNILLDGGSGTIRRMADFGLDYRTIDTICYSHMHPDHCFDLVPLLFAWKHDSLVETPRSLKIICPKGFTDYFNALMDIYGDWVLGDHVSIDIMEVEREKFALGNLSITSAKTEHTAHSLTYRFEEEQNSLFYSGDTDKCDELVESGKGAHTVILECSFPDGQKRDGHLTPTECGEIAKTMACQRLLLTHFYPEILDTDIKSSVSNEFNGEILLAVDGMELEI